MKIQLSFLLIYFSLQINVVAEELFIPRNYIDDFERIESYKNIPDEIMPVFCIEFAMNTIFQMIADSKKPSKKYYDLRLFYGIANTAKNKCAEYGFKLEDGDLKDEFKRRIDIIANEIGQKYGHAYPYANGYTPEVEVAFDMLDALQQSK